MRYSTRPSASSVALCEWRATLSIPVSRSSPVSLGRSAGLPPTLTSSTCSRHASSPAESFSAFFSLTADGASYAGAFQEAARDVARNDLPVRRFNRPETQSARVISQTQSPDFEYTAASVSESLQEEPVDPPGTFGEPSSFGKTS